MISIKKYTWIEFVAHVAFWTGLALLVVLPKTQNTVIVESFNDGSQQIISVTSQWLIFGGNALLFYSNTLLFYPLLLRRDKLWKYVLAMALVVGFILVIEYQYFKSPLYEFTIVLFKQISIHHFIFIVFSFVYILAKHHVTLLNRSKETEMHRLSSELKFLKSQLNPHFLFNSINNIFSISQKNGDDEVANLIANLSKTLRYSLYESNEQKVLLTKELEFIECFIRMSLLKYKDDQVSLSYEKTLSNEGSKIEPLLLVPLIENAFKHCSKHNPTIDISIELTGTSLKAHVSNNKDYLKVNDHTLSGGIGLTNLKRRLELLYPDNHRLDIDERGDIYTTELEVFLNGF